VTTGSVATCVTGTGGDVTGATVEAMDDAVVLDTECGGVVGGGATAGARCSLSRSGRTRISASRTGSDDETRQVGGEASGDRVRIP